MKKLYMFLLLLVTTIVLMYSPVAQASEIDEWPTANGVQVDKTWTISFNKTIKNGISLADYIYVLDEQQQKVDVKLSRSENNKQVIVKAPTKGYEPEKTYTLMVLKGLPSQSGKVTRTTTQKQFTTTSNVLFLKYAKNYMIENTTNTDVNATVGTAAQVVIYDAQGQVINQQTAVKTGVILLHSGEHAVISYMNVPTSLPKAPGLVVKETTTPAFTAVQLAKGGSVKMKSTSNFYRQVQANDPTQKAEVAYANYYTVANKQIIQAATYQAVNTNGMTNVALLYGNGEMIVSNEKDTPFTLYVPTADVAVTQTDDLALVSYELASGENAIITSTAPIMTSDVANHFEIKGNGKYHKVAYANDVTTLTDYAQQQSVTTKKTEDIYENGETIIQNVGSTTLKIYGAAKYTVIQKTTENALTYYPLLPLQSVTVQAKDNVTMRDFSIYDVTAKGQYRTKQYVKNNLKDDRTTTMQMPIDTALIYKDGMTTVENQGGTTLELFGPTRYIQYIH